MNNRIIYFIKSLSLKQIIFSSITVISLLLYLVLTVWSNHQVAALTDQQAAKRGIKKEAVRR